MNHRSRTVCLAIIAAVGILALAVPAAVSAKDVVHRGKYWSWTGPGNWLAVYSAYGLSVSNPRGTSAIDLGFSTTACATGNSVGQSVNRHFAAQRRAINRGTTRITDTSGIRRVAGLGPNYFRQKVSLKSRHAGTPLRGRVFLDYQVNDTFYCYQRNRLMVVPKRGFGAHMKQLNRIYRSFAYFGPGV